jgi:FAD/FMN-containing dehydrogenase
VIWRLFFRPRCSHCSLFGESKNQERSYKIRGRLQLQNATMKRSCYLGHVLLMAGYCCMGGVHAGEKVFVNWHFNRGVGGPYDTIFHPTNNINDTNGDKVENEQDKMIDAAEAYSEVTPQTQKEGLDFPLLTNPLDPQNVDFKSGLQGLKDIVEKATTDGKRLRPYGSRWSLSEVAYSEDYMIDTYGLNYLKIGIENENHLTAEYQDKKGHLAFSQSGVMVGYLYQALFKEGLTLSTSGTLDGQTIGGSVSTGTHNAAMNFGCMHDFVRGIHLVIGAETVLIQKSTDRVVTDDYLVTIGADRMINDDAMFNAAVLSLGTFGIVHGILIEVEPLFELNVQVSDFSFSEARDAIYSLDINSLGFDLDNPEKLPYMFHAFANPYRLDSKDGLKVRVMQRMPNKEVSPDDSPREIIYHGTDPLSFMGSVVTQGMIERMRMSGNTEAGKELMRRVFGLSSEITIVAMMQFGGLKAGTGYPMELFGDPENTSSAFASTPVSTTTMEVCMSLDDLPKVLPMMLEILHEYPTPSCVEIRYVKSSKATLATSRFGDISAYVEIASIDLPETRELYQRVMDALEDSRDDGINFTYHWGKVLPLNDSWIERSYGLAVVTEWKMQRARLLTPQMSYIFSNDYTDTLGLTT